ncbi:MAG: S-layer homology domain-containing protein, partial [Bacillota bacterium]|nr:S-layer homology domain-containing protein [Bacillota bacterium]
LLYSRNSEVQYLGKDSMQVDFMLKTGSNTVEGIQTAIIAVDLRLFDLLYAEDGEVYNETEIVFVEGESCADVSGTYAYTAYRASAKNRMQGDTVFYKNGDVGLISLNPYWLGTSPVAFGESTSLMSVLLGLKEGVSWDALPEGCMRLATAAEAEMMRATAVVSVSYGSGGEEYYYRHKDSSVEDSLVTTPEAASDGSFSFVHVHTMTETPSKEASCGEAGYTGDTWCLDCETMIQSGTELPATGDHVDADGEWNKDADKHWHACSCGEKANSALHVDENRGNKCDTCAYVFPGGEEHPVVRKYRITAKATEGGSISPAGVSKVSAGRNKSFSITGEEGYVIESVIVDGKDLGAIEEYRFKNVRKNHSIYAIFKPAEWKNPYSDISKGDWYYDDVAYVTEAQLMNGVGNQLFAPAAMTDRAMLVTVLWRMEGSPVLHTAPSFTDVSKGLWYSEAISWAAAKGIVKGYGNGYFGPTEQITREQVMAILHRYAAYKGWDEGLAVGMVAQHQCSVWAENDVNWASMKGLLSGIAVDLSFMTERASRAEIAAYLHRFCENIIPEDQ